MASPFYPGGLHCTKIPLFLLCSVDPVWLSSACHSANQGLYIDTEHVEVIHGDFTNWTLHEVSRWVIGHLFDADGPYAARSFLVIDQKDVQEGTMSVVSIDPQSCRPSEAKEGKAKIEGILRTKPEEAACLASIFQANVQGIENYPCEMVENEEEEEAESVHATTSDFGAAEGESIEGQTGSDASTGDAVAVVHELQRLDLARTQDDASTTPSIAAQPPHTSVKSTDTVPRSLTTSAAIPQYHLSNDQICLTWRETPLQPGIKVRNDSSDSATVIRGLDMREVEEMAEVSRAKTSSHAATEQER